MIPMIAFYAVLIPLSPECIPGDLLAAAFNPCPRPTDQHGLRYEFVTGAYQSRGVTPGGGKFATVMAVGTASPVSLNVTDDVYDVAGTLSVGTRITLFGYVADSRSGAQPPYSCIELTH
jgi:hypothetical protein